MKNRLREILAAIPAWQDATIEKMPAGSGGGAWLLQHGDQRAVLTLHDQDRPGFLARVPDEVALQQRAAAMGFAAKVMYHDTNVTLSEFIPGRAMCPADIADAQKLTALARTLARLHALPPTGHRFEPMVAAQHYLAHIAPEHSQEAQRHVERIRDCPAPDKLVCSHNDLVNENILVAEDALWLIDFEYCADNDPMFDIAAVVQSNSLGQSQIDALLAAYTSFTGRPDDRYLRQRLASCRTLYRSLCWLWEAARS